MAALSLVSDGQAAVAEEPGDRPFDLPAVPAETLAGLDAGPGDARDDAPLAQPLQPLGGVVRLVGAEPAGAASAGTAPRADGGYAQVYRFVYLLPTWCYFLWNLKIPVSRCPRSRGSFNQGLHLSVGPTIQLDRQVGKRSVTA